MFFYRFVLIIYLIVALYTSILKLRIGPIYFLDFLFLFSFIYVIKNRKVFSKYNSEFKARLQSIKILKYFLIIGYFFIVISFLNYIKVYEIDGFELLKDYIPRHSYFIFYSFIGFSLFVSINKHIDKFISD